MSIFMLVLVEFKLSQLIDTQKTDVFKKFRIWCLNLNLHVEWQQFDNENKLGIILF